MTLPNPLPNPLPKRILVATDFSDHAERAGQVAMTWAQRLDAELHWAHGVEALPKATPPSAAALVTSFVDRARQHGHEQLSAAKESARSQGVHAECHLVEAPAHRGVIDLAEKLGADLVVVGSRGHGALASLVLGSVAERIVRDAPCRVAVVRGESSAVDPGTIVLGDDLTDLSDAARQDAMALAQLLVANLDVVHAPDLGIPYLSSLGFPVPSRILEELRPGLTEQMNALLGEPPEGIDVSKVIAQDSAAHAICERAKQLRSGLIVVGTRSPSDIERVLLGSVADQVVRHAPCTVLVVR